MSTASYVRRHVNLLGVRQIFSIRDVLHYGDRDLIDHALEDLVKKERIVRLAVGIYMKGDEAAQRPPLFEVVIARGNAYGWNLHLDAANAQKLEYNPSTLDSMSNLDREITFFISGNSTSFRYGNTKIIIKAISPRKLKELKDQGKLIEINHFANKSGSSASTRSANFFNRLKE